MESNLQIVKTVLLILSLTLGFVANSTEVELIQTGNFLLADRTLNVTNGDVVRVIAPARKSPDAALPLIKVYVESLGLVANISENIYSTEDPFYSNTDEFRANDLISALLDDNVKIIWCVRGGTGSIRLIPYLEDKLPPTLSHKILIGYSDITVLHLYLQSKYGWQTIQGPMLEAITNGGYALTSESVVWLQELIFEERDKICLNATKLSHNINVTRIESKVVGGNAVLVEASIGTMWEVNANGRILFLEDTGEASYRIERSLDHMKQAGVFNGVDAVIFSDFIDTTSNPPMEVVFDRFAESVTFPVFRVTGMGHGNINYPLPFLTYTEIKSVEGAAYEFCVNNIQNTTSNNTTSNSEYLTSNFNLLTGILICVWLCLY